MSVFNLGVTVSVSELSDFRHMLTHERMREKFSSQTNSDMTSKCTTIKMFDRTHIMRDV